MTKTEALNTLMKMRAWRKWGKEQIEEERSEMPEQKEVDEAFDVCIKLLQSLLPSNVNEAAELSANDAMIKRQFPSVVYNTGLNCFNHSDLIKQFKAGVEWIVGQGYTKEGIARPDDNEIWVNLKNTDIKDGDKVVIQIRKK